MCVTSLLGGSWADLWPFYGLCCERFSLYIEEKSTLGTRGFSWAVSGFGQVLKSGSLKKSSPLVSSAFGRTRVGLWPTKRSSPSHAWKNLWYLGKEERGKRKEERGKRKLEKVQSVAKHGFVFWAQRKPNTKLEIYKVFQDRLTFLNRHMIV